MTGIITLTLEKTCRNERDNISQSRETENYYSPGYLFLVRCSYERELLVLVNEGHYGGGVGRSGSDQHGKNRTTGIESAI